MDFMNLAKQGFEAFEGSQSANKTGGEEYNSPDNQPHAARHRPDFDDDEVRQNAAQQGSDPDMVSQAMNHIRGNPRAHEEPIDEEHVTNSHREAYENGNAGSLSAGSMGSAAALQIFKQFTGGGGGGSQNQLISMAMSEAGNLFESSGGASSGSKQDAMNGAGMMVMKMLVQSKMSSMMGGGNSGGLGGMSSMLGLASKFL